MGFTFGRRRTDARQDNREIPAADNALSEILREMRAITSDQRTTPDQRSKSDQRTDTALSDTPRGTRPSLDSTARPANLKEDQFRGVRPSFGTRASRALTWFLIAAFISVGSIFAWQSYGAWLICDRQQATTCLREQRPRGTDLLQRLPIGTYRYDRRCPQVQQTHAVSHPAG